MLRYRRDVPVDDPEALDATIAHVRAHLSAVADTDDDPDTRAEDVTVRVEAHPDTDSGLLCVIGELDAAPDAPYLRDDYDPADDHPGIEFQPYREPAP